MKKMFDASIKHFCSADQIYRTLNKLTSEELISKELVIRDNKPNSKIYHITEKGKEDFLNWLNLFFIELTYDYGLMLHQSMLHWIEKKEHSQK